jgi:hypothetical protein
VSVCVHVCVHVCVCVCVCVYVCLCMCGLLLLFACMDGNLTSMRRLCRTGAVAVRSLVALYIYLHVFRDCCYWLSLVFV